MRLQVIKNRILFWVKKILLYSAFAFIAFVSLSFLIFQFPEVQTALIGRFLKGFSQVVGFPTSVERMDLRWYDRLEMKKVLIKDPEHNEMISVGSLIVNFGFLDLLTNGKVNIEAADIDLATVSLIKIAESDTSKNLNINIFIKKINEKFSSGKGGPSSSKLNIGEVELDHSQFIYSINFIAKLKNTSLDPKDLALFNYGLRELPQRVMVSGNATGKVDRFVFRNMDLVMGGTRIAGRLRMDGLPDVNETFIDLKINDGLIHQSDIQYFMPKNFYSIVKPLGRTHAQIEFTGFINDFVAKGNLATSLGKVKSDVNLKVNEKDVGQSTFRGNLSLTNFELGKYLSDTINFQRVTLSGRINGKGLTRETTDFTLTGQVNSIGFRQYNYSNITTNARFAAQLFNGVVSINDPNLKFSANGFIDFREGKDIIQVKATLDTAIVDRLGFIKDPLFVSSYFDVNTRGLKLDSLFGSVVLRNTRIDYKSNVLNLDSIHIISAKVGTDRQLKLRISIADFNIQGNFKYTSVYTDLSRLAKEFYLSLKNDREALSNYYKLKKETSQQKYYATFELKVHDMRPLAVLGNVDLFVSPNSK